MRVSMLTLTAASSLPKVYADLDSSSLLAEVTAQELLSFLGSIKLSISCSQSSIDCPIATQ
jgi:hypothetical protein